MLGNGPFPLGRATYALTLWPLAPAIVAISVLMVGGFAVSNEFHIQGAPSLHGLDVAAHVPQSPMLPFRAAFLSRGSRRRADMCARSYLALDLGAESGRAVLGQFDGERLVCSEVHRFAKQPVQLPGALHWTSCASMP